MSVSKSRSAELTFPERDGPANGREAIPMPWNGLGNKPAGRAYATISSAPSGPSQETGADSSAADQSKPLTVRAPVDILVMTGMLRELHGQFEDGEIIEGQEFLQEYGRAAVKKLEEYFNFLGENGYVFGRDGRLSEDELLASPVAKYMDYAGGAFEELGLRDLVSLCALAVFFDFEPLVNELKKRLNAKLAEQPDFIALGQALGIVPDIPPETQDRLIDANEWIAPEDKESLKARYRDVWREGHGDRVEQQREGGAVDPGECEAADGGEEDTDGDRAREDNEGAE